MKRRKFLKISGSVGVAAMVAPTVLVEESLKVEPVAHSIGFPYPGKAHMLSDFRADAYGVEFTRRMKKLSEASARCGKNFAALNEIMFNTTEAINKVFEDGKKLQVRG